ncbi:MULTISPECIES: sulfatase [unclassified Microbacterium]|uniref:sulfatase family protein n=1 Tax=unclassified Microbacterium TaxID=2609290 RepID=UPI0012FCD022|nr:sulfatase [Microbacterium sp. MAH-37]MVQ43676.1 sulfatase-like hydrolase/transferase [Microbacterium sp. MAH-37]
MSAQRRPNFVFVLTDDHAPNAISAYGSVVNSTPGIDAIAEAGMRFDRALVENSLCTPSRAAILTGTYSHTSEVTTLATHLTNDHETFITALKDAGYRTAMFGKWHLGHGEGYDPAGFDHWEVLPDQGEYFDPELITAEGRTRHEGYVTDILTEHALTWMAEQGDEPYCVLVWHKAPHRSWLYHPRHAELFTDPIPLPPTFEDDYSGRGTPAHSATMRIADHLYDIDLKQDPPSELAYEDRAVWKYQRYMQDYLRCVAAVDESVQALTSFVSESGHADDTVTIYASDQGFYLGEHGWFDKRFMYEESLRMPLILSYPARVAAGQTSENLVSNVDIAQTILDFAGVEAPADMQGASLAPMLTGDDPAPVRDAHYYRFYEHDDHMHHVWAHYGIRTDRYKLIYFYADGMDLPNTGNLTFPPEWELFDLENDPHELHSVHLDPAYADIRRELTLRLWDLQLELGDTPHPRQPAPEGRTR